MAAIRVALLALLAVLLVRPPEPRAADAAGAPVVRRDVAPPTPSELERLAAVPGPFMVLLPEPAPSLEIAVPRAPRSGRAAALSWTLRDEPGSERSVRLSDETGPVDSARVLVGPDGRAQGAFRVRPAREGWHEWRVTAGALASRGAAWTRPSAPLRVLVAPGADWLEGRDVARALEAAGAEVTLVQPLGRGLALGNAPAELPGSASELGAWDVILLLSGARATAAQARALLEHAHAGGGVLAAGGSLAYLPLAASPAGAVREVPARDLSWALPPEVPSLPATDVTLGLLPLAPAPGATVHATAGGLPVLLLGHAGRGRLGALAIADTRAFGLESGRWEQLSAFWGGLAEWLAAGRDAGLVVQVDPSLAAPGSAVAVILERVDPAEPRHEAVELRRPDGRTELLPVAWTGETGRARFVSDRPGRLAVGPPGEDQPRAVHLADPEPSPQPDAWARLALLAAAKGGAALFADTPGARLDRDAAPPGRGPLPVTGWLALALLLAGFEWTARRLRGLP